MSTQGNDQTDRMIKGRNRVGRLIVLIVLPFIITLGCALLVSGLVSFLLDLTWIIGAVPGFMLGLYTSGLVIGQSFINNKPTLAFVTVDAFRSLLGKKKVLVSYGPGMHVSYPWEIRTAGNSIGLDVVSELLAEGFTVQFVDGELTFTGSFRFHADITRLPEFLSGVGASSAELRSAVQAAILQEIASANYTSSEQARQGIAALNTTLYRLFVANHVHHIIEARYGLVFDGIEISEGLESAEVRKTRAAASEARVIAKSVRESLCLMKGIQDADYEQAVRDRRITNDEISVMRDRLMAMSDNMPAGFEVKQTTNVIDIRGLENLSPDVINAIVAGARAINAARGARGGKSGSST